MVLTLVQFSVALIFLYQARAYLQPILAFLAREEQSGGERQEQQRQQQQQQQQQQQHTPHSIRSTPHAMHTTPQPSEASERTEHLVRWICRSAAFMILSTLSLVFGMAHIA